MNVLAAEPEDFAWLESRAKCHWTEDFRAIKAVNAAGRIRGMVGYCNWTQNAVQAHMAVDAPIAWRSLRGPAFVYPFELADRGVLFGMIPAWNAPSLAMARSLGFRETYRIQDGHSVGVALIVIEMRRDDWRRAHKGDA